MTNTQKDKPLFPHLRYATLSDVRQELPSTLVAWLFLSLLFGGIAFAAEFGEQFLPSETSTWDMPFPHWAIYPGIVAIALWFLRGKTLRVPMLTFRGWLAASLYIAVFTFIVSHAPLWIIWPVVWGNTLLWSLLETLDDKGRENFEALKGGR